MRMAKDHDDPVPLLLADLQATAHQRRAEAPALVVGQYRHRCEGEGRNRPGLSDDREGAEQGASRDLTSPGLEEDEDGPQA